MKESIKNIKSWIIFWITVFLTIFFANMIYASWLNVDRASTWSQLESESWNNLIDNVDFLREEIAWLNEAPKNAVMAFADSSCPLGWIPADWTSWTPDLRWVFIRWANSFDNWLTTNTRDEDRSEVWQDKVIPWNYNLQEDAIRNIEWTITKETWGYSVMNSTNWVFKSTSQRSDRAWAVKYTIGNVIKDIIFNASDVVPTWKDNRPKNIALIYCVKK